MKSLHLVTAVIEAGAGLALMGFPSVVIKLLLGVPLEAPASVSLGRLTGAALFALGIACWFASSDTKNRAAKGLVAAMTFYNLAAVGVFMHAGIGLNLVGVALWPAVIVHTAMAIWCVACLIRNRMASLASPA
jgi:hypothetical protein